jgi:hypothetical protein
MWKHYTTCPTYMTPHTHDTLHTFHHTHTTLHPPDAFGEESRLALHVEIIHEKKLGKP